jgi:hypothetical protein
LDGKLVHIYSKKVLVHLLCIKILFMGPDTDFSLRCEDALGKDIIQEPLLLFEGKSIISRWCKRWVQNIHTIMAGSGCLRLTIECTPLRILVELDIVIEVDFDGSTKVIGCRGCSNNTRRDCRKNRSGRSNR